MLRYVSPCYDINLFNNVVLMSGFRSNQRLPLSIFDVGAEDHQHSQLASVDIDKGGALEVD